MEVEGVRGATVALQYKCKGCGRVHDINLNEENEVDGYSPGAQHVSTATVSRTNNLCSACPHGICRSGGKRTRAMRNVWPSLNAAASTRCGLSQTMCFEEEAIEHHAPAPLRNLERKAGPLTVKAYGGAYRCQLRCVTASPWWQRSVPSRIKFKSRNDPSLTLRARILNIERGIWKWQSTET
jgi:hypothetical protein